MSRWKLVPLALFLAAGCRNVVAVDARMPPLLPVQTDLKTIAVGRFTAARGTPANAGSRLAGLLAQDIRDSSWYDLAQTPDAAQLVVSGIVTCRITDGTATRPGGLAAPATVKMRTAEVAVTFTGTAGKAMKLFTVTERPTVDDKRLLAEEFPDRARLEEVLLRSCVRAFVADLSPRRVRVWLPRPPFAHRYTRRGIDRLTQAPAEAIIDLTKAVERDPKDAAALNALGLCSEMMGNLDLALSSYASAVASSGRKEYRENMRRVHARLERRRALLGTGKKTRGGSP